MYIVTVKNKFQIVIPQHVRELAHIEIGDLLQAAWKTGKSSSHPKAL